MRLYAFACNVLLLLEKLNFICKWFSYRFRTSLIMTTFAGDFLFCLWCNADKSPPIIQNCWSWNVVLFICRLRSTSLIFCWLKLNLCWLFLSFFTIWSFLTWTFWTTLKQWFHIKIPSSFACYFLTQLAQNMLQVLWKCQIKLITHFIWIFGHFYSFQCIV